MPSVPLRANAGRALLCACALGLLTAAPAVAQRVDLGAVGVDVSPGGADVNVDAGGVGNADVNAGPNGVGVEADVGGNQVGAEVPLPTPAVPGVPGRESPTTSSSSGNDSGAGNQGGGGSGASTPSTSGGRQTSTGGGDGSGGGGDRDDRGGGRDGSRRDRGGRDSGGDDGSGAAAGGGPGSVEVQRAATTTESGDGAGAEDDDGSGVTRTLERVVEVIPTPIWAAIIILALLTAGFFGRSLIVARRARHLTAQRESLLKDVGLLQEALLPEIPEKLGELATSVAYRPADGPAAGGDFYDAFLLDGERVAIIVGDVSGHGRAALARTALMRYTLRAYLDAGLEPRRALKVAGKALDDDLGGDFATVVLAVHDPAHATLTYSCAGHPPPIVTGSGAFDPVTALSSPPIGVGLPTGQRQTTLHLPGDAIACLFTDGLVEARHAEELIGREKLADTLSDLGPHATAAGVIDAIAFYADETPDDMAACVLRPEPAAAADHVPDRVEEVELNAVDLTGDRVARFLAACSVKPDDVATALKSVQATVGEFGCALLRVRVDKVGARCEVESAAGLHDPLGAPPELGDAPAITQPITQATSDAT